MKTALVTSLGSVAGDIVIKSLKRLGFRVIGCDIYPKEWVVDAYTVDVFYQAPYATNLEKYLQFMEEVCVKENVQYILPLTDIEVDLFNEHRDWIDAHNVCVCISPKSALDIIRNKKILADFIAENCKCIKSIPTLMLKDIEELPWDFPVVCKPYNGRSSQGLKYIYNKEEWEAFAATADKNVYIVEPFIKGHIVMVEIVRQSEMNKTITITRKELISTPHGCATTVYMYQDEDIEERSRILAEKLGIMGCVNFEYLRDNDGVYHFVECNPRFSAGAEFSCMMGYDCVGNHIRCFENKPIDDFKFTRNQIIARKYEEFLTHVEEER